MSPGAEAAKHPQFFTLPPPCLTVGIRFVLWNVVWFLPGIMGACRVLQENVRPFFMKDKMATTEQKEREDVHVLLLKSIFLNT
jgi:hypothetical protein